MNYKRLFKKSTIVYFIIILALGILFNSNRTKKDIALEEFTNRTDKNKLSDIIPVNFNNNNNNNNKEGFKSGSGKSMTSSSTVIATLIPIYEAEKDNFITTFKNGEEIFNNIIDLSHIIVNNDISTLITPSELSDLATNIKTDIDDLVIQIFKDFENIKLEEVDNYLETDYIKLQETVLNKYSNDYPIKELLQKELTELLIEKIDYTLENEGNSKNFKYETFNELNSTMNTTILSTATTQSRNSDLIGLDKVNSGLDGKMAEADRDAKIIEMTRKLTYIRGKITGEDPESAEELKKLMEGFYNPTSTFSGATSTTLPSSPLTTSGSGIGPRIPQPKSFDGLSNEELEVIKRNQIANTPQNIDTILIDPLKAVETVQDDIIGLLETFNSNEKKKYLNRQFDPTNRGSYLTNSLTDRIQDTSIQNLSYYSNPHHSAIIPPKEKVLNILANKEYRQINHDSNSGIEGFEVNSENIAIKDPKLFGINNSNSNNLNDNNNNSNNKKSEKQSEILNIADNFVKYSSSTILGLVNKVLGGTMNIDINNMDNNKMQSYGVIIIAVAILLFFISASD
jgi:hypothetical protein